MKTLIVFGEDWGAHPSSTQHLIKQLSHDYDVIWINSIGLRKPKFRLSDFRRVFDKIFSRQKKSNGTQADSHSNVTVIAPKVWPLATQRWAVALNCWLLKRAVLPSINSNEAPIVWTSLPSSISYQGCFGESLIVYYCGDDFSYLAGVDHKLVSEFERALIEKSDHVFVASQVLVEKFNNPKVTLLEHGVDTQLFSEEKSRAIDLPTDKPIAGFYGALAHWLDQDLLIKLALKRKDWNFVFVGQCLVDVQSLLNLPNVHWLGPRPHNALPSYSQHWQVSMLPFILNDQILACNPLKLREYMAAGTPILATSFPALKPYKNLLHSISNVEQASKALDQVLQDTKHTERKTAVKNESWQARALVIKNVFSELQNENANAECNSINIQFKSNS